MSLLKSEVPCAECIALSLWHAPCVPAVEDVQDVHVEGACQHTGTAREWEAVGSAAQLGCGELGQSGMLADA